MPRKVLRGSELITKDLAVAGALDVTGNAAVGGNAAVSGNVEVTGDLTVGGSYTLSGTDLEDSTTFHDPDAATKKARLDCVGVTEGETRVFTVPDYDGTIATLAGVESLTNKSLTSPKIVTGINDANAKELLKVTATADAVNEFTLANGATGSGPSLTATGDDANIPATLAGKGTGAVILGQATSTDVRLAADQPIGDSSGNELIEFAKTAAAVNHPKVTNAATGTAPKLEAAGSDASACLQIGGKGAPVVPITRLLGFAPAATTMTDASDQALSAGEAIGGVILRDCNGANRQDTMPAAADVVAAILQPVVGTEWLLMIRNTSDAAETITIAAPGADVTLSGTMTIAQSKTRLFLIHITNVGVSTEAYTVYAVGLLDN